jgi:hypothetical protein
MLRAFGQISAILILTLAGAAAYYVHTWHDAAERRLREAEARNQQLQQIVGRLSAERRVAEVLVTEQSRSGDGVLHTDLLLVETSHDGAALPPKAFRVDGDQVHIDAMVIKFDRHFVQEGDPLRGHSVALFTRIYGDAQAPATATFIDRPGTVPDVYRGSSDQVTTFETSLWRDFWRLFDDEEFRRSKGVRVANGQGVWGPLIKDRLYTVTLESDGGLNLTSEPVKGIYREAMRYQQHGSARP